MKNQILGRKVGSGKDMTCLTRGDGAPSGGEPVDPGVIDEFVAANTRRVVKLLREKGVEGYVLLEGDPTPYEFMPDADFVYPVVTDQENIELRVYLFTGGWRAIQTPTHWRKTTARECPARLVTMED